MGISYLILGGSKEVSLCINHSADWYLVNVHEVVIAVFSAFSFFHNIYLLTWASQVALAIKNSPANTGAIRDTGLIPGSGRSPAGGHGNPLLYSCLENPMDRGAWRAMVHGVTQSCSRLK